MDTEPRVARNDDVDESDSVWAGAAEPGRRSPLRLVVPIGAVGAALLWSYAPELRRLWTVWGEDPNYSHGYMVPLVSALIFWRRGWGRTNRLTAPSQLGWLLVLLSLAARGFAYEHGHQWASTITLLPALAGLTLSLGGWGLFRRAWPSVAYLVFMIPLPPRLNAVLAQPLQSLATDCSAAILHLSGLWVLAEGNVIYVGRQPLNVAEACNGLSMLMCLLATVVAAVMLLPTSFRIRAALVVSAVPVALLSNVLRIVATGWCVHRFGPEAGARMGHDVAGWLMMPVALVLVGLELLFLIWLVSEKEVENEPLLLGPSITHHRSRDRFAGPGAAGVGRS